MYLRLFRVLAPQGFRFADPMVKVSDTGIVRALAERAGLDREDIRRRVRPQLSGSAREFLAERGVELPGLTLDPARDLGDLAAAPSIAPLLARLRHVRTRVFDELAHEFPEVVFRFDLSRLEGLGYYDGLCVSVEVATPEGDRLDIVDGGVTDWTQRLLSDRKERFLQSGIGTEFTCKRYRISDADQGSENR